MDIIQDGTLKAAAGQKLTDEQLLSIDWLVKKGTLPKVQQLFEL